MSILRIFQLEASLIGIASLTFALCQPGLAHKTRFTTNDWHGVGNSCELAAVMQGNNEVARLRLGEVYIWRDLPASTIGSRCIAPASVPRSGSAHASHCAASTLAIASFEIELRPDGGKTRVLRVVCIE
jgi:hypothetical protein